MGSRSRWVVRSALAPALGVALAAAGAACVGEISEPGEPPAAGAGAGAGGAGGAAPPRADAPGTTDTLGSMPLRRLSRDEYAATVSALLGDTAFSAGDFPEERPNSGGFPVFEAITAVDRDALMNAAEKVAAAAVPRFAQILPCNPAATGEGPCVDAFLHAFAKRAFRRPVDADDIAALRKLYDDARGPRGESFEDAIRRVIEGVLQAPQFLYRWELGASSPSHNGSVVRLDSYEIASRLSYFLWGSMPDDALFAAADAGGLQSPDDIGAQARRMVSDPRAKAAIGRYFGYWFNLGKVAHASKDAKSFPDYTPKLQAAMVAETEAFASYVTLDGAGGVRMLLTGVESASGAPFTFANADLAKLYGVSGVAGDAMVRVALDPARRAGVLTQAAILASTAGATDTSPTQRGKLVRQRLLCTIPPNPPPNVPPISSSVTPGSTTRQAYEQHVASATCAGCHTLMDPIGFGSEHYDAIGRWRDTDNAHPVDATGAINAIAGGPRTFDGAVAMSSALAETAEVRACVARQFVRLALARDTDARDETLVKAASDALASPDTPLRDVLVAITRAPGFAYRAAADGEVLP